MRSLLSSSCLLALIGLLGCGGEGGPSRFRVSGDATYDGKPIVFGDVVFTPNDKVKNSGPQGIANIRDGKFDTSATGGKGFGGGPTIVRVTGFSAQGGKLLCEYEYEADLPKSDATHKIEVPAKGAAGEKKATPEI